MKVAIYIRVSTDEQATKGNSLLEQRERLEAYCKAMDWEEYEVFEDDGYSAKDMNRPKLQEMIEQIRNNKIQMVVTTKIDRLCRNLLDLLTFIDDLVEYDCGYVSASESFDTSTPAGRMVLQILGAFAEFERERIRERVKDNMKSLAKKTNKVINRPCYGYDVVDGEYVINQREAEIIRKMANWAISGDGCRSIAIRLKGELTKDGNSFSEGFVRKLLQRETIAGMFVYNRKYTLKNKTKTRPKEEWIVNENHHEAIIDRETYELVQMAISSRQKSKTQADNDRWLLSGLTVCGHCGANMTGQYRKKGSKEYFHYLCSAYHKKGECFRHSIVRDKVELAIIKTLEKIEEYAQANMLTIETTQKSEVNVQALQDRLKKINNKMQKQIELYEDDEINKEDFRRAADRIEKERLEITKELELAQQDSSKRIQDQFVKRVKTYKGDWSSDDRQIVKNCLRQLVSRIVVNGKKVDITFKF
ncbi:recombinase family protein [Paenibacillus cremeus]|uniref:Recombinase family protein n=1 Tax=Paenibacillus cremeus TaxID=2163881 RepID=A0A559KD38_9BACL|nr:recombinase family protein [Paenibacillus cremeus]TVY09999.1 recombinase family protein [Paenibacillus cremeus]